MGKGKLTICFVLSLIIIGITFFTYGEAVENTMMSMIHAGTMPERYLESEGWGFDYAPVERFMMLSVGFCVLYYGTELLLKSHRVGILFGSVMLAVYVIGYIYIMLAFWQLIGVTMIPMILLCGIAVFYLISRKKMRE